MKLTGLTDLYANPLPPRAKPLLPAGQPAGQATPTDRVKLSEASTPCAQMTLPPEKPASTLFTARGVDQLAREAGVAIGAQGTLLMLQDTPLIGADLLLSPVPQQFNKHEVHKYYLSADENSLSEVGKALYSRVRDKYLNTVPESTIGSPTIYCTGGLPGSGKGSLVEAMWLTSPDFVQVDPDRIKHDIIEDLATKNPGLREQMASDREWGTAVHWTSSIMARDLMKEAIHSGRDIVFDSSMSTPDQNKYREMAHEARDHGYRVNAFICQVDVDKSIERAKKRSNKPVVIPTPDGDLVLPGRLVTADYVRECNERLQDNIDHYKGEGLFDRISFYDNSRDGHPVTYLTSYRRAAGPDGTYHSEPDR